MSAPPVDPGSLDRLHDIVVPRPVPWWPPAPAWYVLAAIAGVAIALAAWRIGRWWFRNRYRRAALAELASLQRQSTQPQTLPALAVLLKRTALAAYPRDRVASLTGSAWREFLDATGGMTAFTTGPGRVLEAGYAPASTAAEPALRRRCATGFESSERPAMLTLDYPWLLALLPAPLLVRWLAPAHRTPATGLRVPFLDRLARLTGRTPTDGAVVRRRERVMQLSVAAAWLCGVAALARPQWLDPPITRTIPVRDMLLAVDLSGSMDTNDFTAAGGKSIDRLTAVKQVLDGFLARRKGDRVGLIVFGNAPFVQAPFTQDLDVCRELLAETRVGMAGPKTAMGDAIGLAVTVFERSKVPERVLIALTDGNDTGSLVPPQKAAEVARDRKITIFTVAVGNPAAAGEDKLDEATLQRVAETTGGTYAHAEDTAQLEAIYGRLDALPTRPAPTITHRPRRDLFHWPLAAGFLASLLPFLLAPAQAARSQPVPRRAAA